MLLYTFVFVGLTFVLFCVGCLFVDDFVACCRCCVACGWIIGVCFESCCYCCLFTGLVAVCMFVLVCVCLVRLFCV